MESLKYFGGAALFADGVDERWEDEAEDDAGCRQPVPRCQLMDCMTGRYDGQEADARTDEEQVTLRMVISANRAKRMRKD